MWYGWQRIIQTEESLMFHKYIFTETQWDRYHRACRGEKEEQFEKTVKQIPVFLIPVQECSCYQHSIRPLCSQKFPAYSRPIRSLAWSHCCSGRSGLGESGEQQEIHFPDDQSPHPAPKESGISVNHTLFKDDLKCSCACLNECEGCWECSFI